MLVVNLFLRVYEYQFHYVSLVSKSSLYFAIIKSPRSRKSWMVNTAMILCDRKWMCECNLLRLLWNMRASWFNKRFSLYLSIEEETHSSLTLFNEVCGSNLLGLKCCWSPLKWGHWGENVYKSMFITRATLKTNSPLSKPGKYELLALEVFIHSNDKKLIMQ